VESETAVQAAWEYRDENILFVRCDWRGFGEMEAAQGQTEEAQAQTEVDLRPRRARFGISILGNQLGLGSAFVTSMMLDDSREPIHKEVLMRMLSYYEIRSETLRLADVLTKTNATQLTAATHRRKQ